SLERQKFLNKWFVKPFYRVRFLPLFGFGRFMCLLHHKGRKSGKKRITPLNLLRIEGVIRILSGRGKRAHWFRNVEANPDDVWVQVGFRKFPVRTKILDPAESEQFCRWYVENNHWTKRMIGWNPSKGDSAETAGFSILAGLIPVLQLHKR
ncbi:MAG: nitroreductase family deazaflavin-dependent oxidoreductase, partial [Candidatus Hodarchaeota archaeon]